RKLQLEGLVGHELRSMHQEALDLHATLERHRSLRRTVRVLMKAWVGISNAVLPILHTRKELSERVVNTVQLLFTVLPRKRAYRLVGLSPSAFHERLERIKAKCGLSPLDRCLKRLPLQLTLKETAAIKALFNADVPANWPASSRYHMALRAGRLRIGMGTFYKYLGIMGLKAARFEAIRKIQGIVATRPNEFLHVDTTEWPLADEEVAYIALVSDNYSKAILGWSVSTRNGASNVIAALNTAIALMQRHHPEHLTTLLVSDGGPENKAVEVQQLLAAHAHPAIRHIVAQKDIRFSNSPIEAINKIMKGYLRNHAPQSLTATEHVVASAVHDYTEVRPHGSLKGATPLERYLNPGFTPAPPDLKAARAQRIEENRQTNCRLERKGPECRS
ncbi:MAG: transposase, partial [Flavobacteriales bacterium]|nr:transposase [Flavobacteriales bacterium]